MKANQNESADAIEVSIDIRERIQNLDDVFALNGTTRTEFEAKWQGFEPHEIGNALEKLIVAAYNEGKIPDWTDGKPKGYPMFRMGSPSGAGFAYYDYDSWYSLSRVGARLVFLGPNWLKNMRDAVAKFLPQYQQSRTF